MKGDGPYQLVPKFSHLEVTEEVWRGLSAKERVARIASVDQAGASAYEVGTPSSLPVDFNGSGLPQTLHTTWSNADTIL